MTGWHIRVGYSSRFSSCDVEVAMAQVIAAVRVDTDALLAEAERVGPVSPFLRDCLVAMAHCTDSTLTRRIGAEGDIEFMLLASGGGEWRDAKEQARRTFVRCVMAQMHARGMDISVSVA